MSGTLDKLFAKGKAKVKEFTDRPPSHQQQGYPGQSYPGQHPPQQQGYPPNQGQYSGAQYPPQHQQYPPQQYQQYPQQNQQWGPPQNQWGPPQQQQQQQWGPPPPQHQLSAPPIPNASKPHSPQPQGQFQPPIPQNRPQSAQPPAPQNLPPGHVEKVYWKPSFDAATPVSHNFEYETGDNGWGNNEKQMYTDTPANSFHHGNRLILRGLVQNGSYTSARLSSHQTLSRPRGYLTATILPPVGEGIWPAYWLLPKEPFDWPQDGEVDIFESWNGDCINHSCLHWGHYTKEEWNKHRVIETPLPGMRTQPHTFGFAWSEEEGIPEWRGRMIWYIDGRPVMKGSIPLGTRRMETWRVLINIAMGGDVCKGQLPRDGYYDMVVSDLKMCEEPPNGGWQQFEHTWSSTTEGKLM